MLFTWLFTTSVVNYAGDLKKMVAGPTGLHHEEQKLIFKDRERESRTFLDVAGVTNGSKIVLVEDVDAKERRYIEARRNAKIEKALKDIAEISLEVDKFAKQVMLLSFNILLIVRYFMTYWFCSMF